MTEMLQKWLDLKSKRVYNPKYKHVYFLSFPMEVISWDTKKALKQRRE